MTAHLTSEKANQKHYMKLSLFHHGTATQRWDLLKTYVLFPLKYHIHVWICPYPLSTTVFLMAQLIPVSVSACCGSWDLKRFLKRFIVALVLTCTLA